MEIHTKSYSDKITVSSESCHRYLVFLTPPDSEHTWIPWLWPFHHLIPTPTSSVTYLMTGSNVPASTLITICPHGTTGKIQKSIHASSSFPQAHLQHPMPSEHTPQTPEVKMKTFLKTITGYHTQQEIFDIEKKICLKAWKMLLILNQVPFAIEF